jgi:hypothetical protein
VSSDARSACQIKTDCVLLVAHGWNIDIGIWFKGSGSVRCFFGGGWNDRGRRVGCVHAVGS